MRKTNHCAVYIRKSREDRDNPPHRLTVQREQLPAHARAQGWSVEVYDDGHASAARGKAEDLKERSRLEADVRAGKVDVILTIELSRLSRDETLEDYLAWLNLCSSHGVKLATLSRVLDPSQHSDWMLLLMEGGFSSVEMKILQARMKEGREEAFRAGRWLGGSPPPPYRYDKDQRKPVIDPQLLEEMKEIWKLAETESARAIAKATGRPEIFIRRAISDERLDIYQAIRRDPKTGQAIPCDWDPVIDADQVARIRAGRRRRKTNGTRREAAGLLSALDLAYCGFCGRTIKTWTNSKTRADGSRLDYYGCTVKNDRGACPNSRMIPQGELERRVLKNLFFTLRRLDELKGFWSQHQNDKGETREELEAIEEEEGREKQKKARLVAAVAEGVLDLAEIKEAKKEIEDRLAELADRRRQILASVQEEPNWKALALPRQDFDLLTFSEQREFIKTTIERIDVFSGHAEPTFRFPRDAKGDRRSRVNLPAPKRQYHKRLPEKFIN